MLSLTGICKYLACSVVTPLFSNNFGMDWLLVGVVWTGSMFGCSFGFVVGMETMVIAGM